MQHLSVAKSAFPSGEAEEIALPDRSPGLGSGGKDELCGPKKAARGLERNLHVHVHANGVQGGTIPNNTMYMHYLRFGTLWR
jgi:hypothetical protein